MRSKTALIFGVTGQIGSYLAELLLSKHFAVVGAARRTSTPSTERLRKCLLSEHFSLLPCDVTDAWSVQKTMLEVRPSHVYNLAAMSFVKASFDEPLHTTSATYLGAVNVLEACRDLHKMGIGPRLYQASSSEMFGSSWSKQDARLLRHDISCRPPSEHEIAEGAFQDEDTPFLPNSPYAIAKLAAHHAVRLYRKSYGLFACAGILFNTESERRGLEFVTRKVTHYVGQLKVGLESGRPFPRLSLGNLQAMRDWSHCEDSTRAMLSILEHDEPDDYVISTGNVHSVQQFVEKAFAAAEIGDWRSWVDFDESCTRPCEVPFLRGRSVKARHVLGWEPQIGLDELVARMVRSDIELARTQNGR